MLDLHPFFQVFLPGWSWQDLYRIGLRNLFSTVSACFLPLYRRRQEKKLPHPPLTTDDWPRFYRGFVGAQGAGTCTADCRGQGSTELTGLICGWLVEFSGLYLRQLCAHKMPAGGAMNQSRFLVLLRVDESQVYTRFLYNGPRLHSFRGQESLKLKLTRSSFQKLA